MSDLEKVIDIIEVFAGAQESEFIASEEERIEHIEEREFVLENVKEWQKKAAKYDEVERMIADSVAYDHDNYYTVGNIAEVVEREEQ